MGFKPPEGLPKLSGLTGVLITPESQFEKMVKDATKIDLPPGPQSMLLKLQKSLEVGGAASLPNPFPNPPNAPKIEEVLKSFPKLPSLPTLPMFAEQTRTGGGAGGQLKGEPKGEIAGELEEQIMLRVEKGVYGEAI